MGPYPDIDGRLDHVRISEQSFPIDHKGRSGAFGLGRSLPGLKSVPLHLGDLNATNAVALNAHEVVAVAVAVVNVADVAVSVMNAKIFVAQAVAILDDSYRKNADN